jgi:hypothetical protein
MRTDSACLAGASAPVCRGSNEECNASPQRVVSARRQMQISLDAAATFEGRKLLDLVRRPRFDSLSAPLELFCSSFCHCAVLCSAVLCEVSKSRVGWSGCASLCVCAAVRAGCAVPRAAKLQIVLLSYPLAACSARFVGALERIRARGSGELRHVCVLPSNIVQAAHLNSQDVSCAAAVQSACRI